MLYRLLLFMPLFLLLVGCGQPKFNLTKPPEVDEDNRGLIMVYRDGKRPGTHHWIGLNGRFVAELKEKEYTEFFVAAGTNQIFTKCTLPTHEFDRFMVAMGAPDRAKDQFYKVDPIITKDLDTCYMSLENESAIGGNCSLVKLKRQENTVCIEKRKQLSYVKPGPKERSQ